VSRFEYEPILPGDTREASRVNGFWTSLAACVPFNHENFRGQGIDSRPLTAYPHGEVVAEVLDTTRVAASVGVTGAAYALFAMGATNFQTAALTVGANDILAIYARVVLQSLPGASLQGLTAGDTFGIRLRYNGATLITGTKREHARPAATTVNNHVCLETFGWLPDGVTPANIELLYRLSAGTAFPVIGHLVCTLFRQVN
jgi:hypothetical protein